MINRKRKMQKILKKCETRFQNEIILKNKDILSKSLDDYKSDSEELKRNVKI